MKNEIILYRPNELAEHIEVRLEDETVWLTQAQMATLFDQTKQNISLHINNCFKENELVSDSVVKESLTTAISRHIINIFKDNELDKKSFVAFFATTTSLKDLGKKCFAFSKLESKLVEGIMNEMKELI